MTWTNAISDINKQSVLTMDEGTPIKPTQADRYREEAAQERRIARQYEGCTWMGNEHPSASHLRKANLLEEAALMWEKLYK